MSSYAITGASKGIGYEFVRQLAANPANTVLAIVRDPSVAAISDITAKHPNVHAIKGNVTDPESILSAAQAVSAITGGKLDVLIHNSNAVDMATMAYSPSQVPLDVAATHTMFDAALSTGIYGGLWTTNAFLPLIEKGSQKKIVHISSAMGDAQLVRKTGISYALAYSIAKAGMNIQVAKYAVELAPKGIKVLALSPGWVDTWEGERPAEMVQANEFMLKQFQSAYPEVKEQIQPEESVRKGLQVIDNLNAKSSGLLLSHNGNSEDWF